MRLAADYSRSADTHFDFVWTRDVASDVPIYLKDEVRASVGQPQNIA